MFISNALIYVWSFALVSMSVCSSIPFMCVNMLEFHADWAQHSQEVRTEFENREKLELKKNDCIFSRVSSRPQCSECRWICAMYIHTCCVALLASVSIWDKWKAQLRWLFGHHCQRINQLIRIWNGTRYRIVQFLERAYETNELILFVLSFIHQRAIFLSRTNKWTSLLRIRTTLEIIRNTENCFVQIQFNKTQLVHCSSE